MAARRSSFLLMVVGLVFCAVTLRDTQIFRDEANTLAIAQAPTFQAAIGYLVRDGNTPLHPLLVRSLFSLFGPTDRVAQMLSVTCFLGACFLLFRWVARMEGMTAGLAALAAAVLGGRWLDIAIQVRPYALLMFLTVAALWTWQDLGFARGRPWRRMIVLWATATASLYTHPWAVFSVVSMGGVSLAVLVLSRGEARKRWAFAVGTLLVAGAAWAPLFLVQMRQLGENLAPWSGPASLASVVLGVRVNLLSLQLLAALAIADAAFFLLRVRRSKEISHEEGEPAWCPALVVFLWIFGLFLLAALASRFTTCWASRYAVIATPGLLFLLGTWVGRMWEGRGGYSRGLARGLVFAGFAGAIGFTAHGIATGCYRKTNARDVANSIMVRWRENDIVVVSSFAHAPAIAHYLPPHVTLITYPYGDRGEITRWVGIERRVMDPSSTRDFEALVLGKIWPGMRVWIVDPFKSTLVGYLVAKDWIAPPLHSHQFNYMEVRRAVEIERWLQARGRRIAVIYPDEEKKMGECFTATLIAVENLGEKPR